jgi:coenzyme PQQ synthesis protein D (PqqD)
MVIVANENGVRREVEMKLASHSRLQPNTDEMVAKVLDGEAVMINISSGVYYSMNTVGGFLWERIEAGLSLEEIVAALTQHYEVSGDRAAADVDEVAARLLEEKLVTVSTSAVASPSETAVTASAKLPYETPKLEIYRDVGHLIALDPPMPGMKCSANSQPATDTPTSQPVKS